MLTHYVTTFSMKYYAQLCSLENSSQVFTFQADKNVLKCALLTFSKKNLFFFEKKASLKTVTPTNLLFFKK
jgi:hypothetical protein